MTATKSNYDLTLLLADLTAIDRADQCDCRDCAIRTYLANGCSVDTVLVVLADQLELLDQGYYLDFLRYQLTRVIYDRFSADFSTEQVKPGYDRPYHYVLWRHYVMLWQLHQAEDLPKEAYWRFLAGLPEIMAALGSEGSDRLDQGDHRDQDDREVKISTEVKTEVKTEVMLELFTAAVLIQPKFNFTEALWVAQQIDQMQGQLRLRLSAGLTGNKSE